MYEIERKFLNREAVEVDTEKRTIQGYFSKLTPDSGKDQVKSGAFTKTISERGPRQTDRGIRSKIKLKVNHKDVIGVPILIREDSQGGYFEGLVDDTAVGNDVLTRIKSGSLDGCSFEYAVLKASYPKNDKNVKRIIEEVRLYEVGPVDEPMHEETEILGLKAKGLPIEELCSRLMDLIHTETDDLSGVTELKALHSELTARLTVAVEETLPVVVSQPKSNILLEELKKFNEKLEKKNGRR